MAKPMESGEMLVASDAFSFPSLRVTGQPNQEAQSDRISDEVLSGWVSESAPENGAATPPDPHFPVTIVTSRYGSEKFFNAIIVTNHTINYTC